MIPVVVGIIAVIASKLATFCVMTPLSGPIVVGIAVGTLAMLVVVGIVVSIAGADIRR